MVGILQHGIVLLLSLCLYPLYPLPAVGGGQKHWQMKALKPSAPFPLCSPLVSLFAPSSLLARWHLLNMAQEHLSGRLSMGLFSHVAVMSQVRKGVLCVNHHISVFTLI